MESETRLYGIQADPTETEDWADSFEFAAGASARSRGNVGGGDDDALSALSASTDDEDWDNEDEGLAVEGDRAKQGEKGADGSSLGNPHGLSLSIEATGDGDKGKGRQCVCSCKPCDTQPKGMHALT